MVPPGFVTRASSLSMGKGSSAGIPVSLGPTYRISTFHTQSKTSSSKGRVLMLPYWKETCSPSPRSRVLFSASAKWLREISIPVTWPPGEMASASHMVWVPIPQPTSSPRLPSGS